MIKLTIVNSGAYVDKPATYTYFIKPEIVNEFVIEKEHAKDTYVVNMLTNDDGLYNLGEFKTYMEAERLIERVSHSMLLDSYTDVDKMREEIWIKSRQ